MSQTEEIMKLKALLDQGAINEEEFQMLKQKVFKQQSNSAGEKEKIIQETPQKEIIKPTNSPAPKKQQKGTAKKRREGNNEVSEKLLYSVFVLSFILSVVLWIRYDNGLLFLLPLLISVGSTIIISRLVLKMVHRNLLFLAMVGLFVCIAAFPIGNTATYESSNSSSSSTSSENKYCSKHQRMYNPNNPWKGCPDCVEEKDQETYKKAIEKARRL